MKENKTYDIPKGIELKIKLGCCEIFKAVTDGKGRAVMHAINREILYIGLNIEGFQKIDDIFFHPRLGYIVKKIEFEDSQNAEKILQEKNLWIY